MPRAICLTWIAAACILPCAGGDEPSRATASGIDRENFDARIALHDDFYAHVNGGWLERTQIPPDKSNYGSFTVLTDESEKALRKIIEASASRPNKEPGSDEQKVGDLYQSFTNIERLNELGLQPLEKELARIAGLQDKSQLIEWMGSAQRRGMGNVVMAFVEPDARKSDEYIVYVNQAGTNLPDRDYYLKDDERFQAIRKAYAQYIEALLTEAKYPEPARAAQRILELETRFAEAQWTRVANRDPVATYNKLNSQEIGALMPHFDWAAYARHAGVGGQSAFIIRQPDFLKGVDRAFDATLLEIWKDYFSFVVLDTYAPALSARFDQLHFEFHKRTLTGVAEQSPRWKRGIDVLNGALGELVGKIYVREYFAPEAKERMEELVDNLKKAFAARIDKLDWMSPGTKLQAHEKLAKFRTKIGYPDQWRDYSKLEIEANDLVGNLMRAAAFEYDRQLAKLGRPIDRGEWEMTPQTVNAYYNPLMNEIVFPAAILQPPFFNLASDDAVNYGAIGAVIGHEISHGFDDKGSEYDGDGNLRKWWTREDREEFDRRGKQLVAQYSQYQPIDKIPVNGELTLGENIGDLGGLSVALTAYELSLDGKSPPVIDGLSGHARFFLGWAQIWRRKYRDEELRRRLLTDPHSPSQYRCNGIVSNLDGFYEAFPVQRGHKMYIEPEQRVRIW